MTYEAGHLSSGALQLMLMLTWTILQYRHTNYVNIKTLEERVLGVGGSA